MHPREKLKHYVTGAIERGEAVPIVEVTETTSPKYNPEAVDQAIRQSRRPIKSKEKKLIHALLKGHSS